MDVAVNDNPDAQRFEITVDGEPAGLAEYRRKPGIIAFIHTEIDSRFEGHGLGGKLVSVALDSVAEQNLAVLPFCPFVNHFIAEHSDYLPLVPAEMREKFGLPVEQPAVQQQEHA
jgi:predicted GNAT family acetyltransferase